MTDDVEPWFGQRPLPKFFLDWRKEWVPRGPSFTPSDYLNQTEAVPVVMMAAWLFCPETAEYSGGVFLAERFRKSNVDTWLDHFDGDVHGAESMVNRTTLYDLFVGADIDPYSEAEFQQLAESIGECWRAVLSRRYADREIVVRVSGEADGDYGPNVTFWTGPKHG